MSWWTSVKQLEGVVDSMNEYQKTFDLCLKIIVYGLVALYFLGFLQFLPDDLSNKIVALLLGKIGLWK